MTNRHNMRTAGAATFFLIIVLILLGCDSNHTNKTVEGIWEGKLKYPGFESRIVFIITVKPDGTLTANMLKPDESDNEVTVSKVVFKNSDLHLEVDSVNASFDGLLKIEEGIIEGKWKQKRWSQPLVLKRVAEVVKPPRPQTPVLPYPYNEENVTFTNRKAGAKLAGTLTSPRTGYPWPAVLLISGGGAHDRDYSILRHRPFLVLADYLTRRGIAVLRFDERGVGESTGDRSQATSENYAEDVLAGVKFLKSHKQIDPNRIGLIGHSEGGTIAALAAAQSPDIAFIVMMGAPGLPGKEYNLQFEESKARSLGLNKEAIAANRSFQELVLSVIIHETDPVLAEAKLRRLYGERFTSMPEDKIEAAIKRFLSPWFRFNVTHDPGATLRLLKCPVLAIFGEKDIQVPHEGNLEAIQQALERGGNTSYKVEKLPGLNHFFQTAPTGSPNEYIKLEETISPVVLKLICTWILEGGD